MRNFLILYLSFLLGYFFNLNPIQAGNQLPEKTKQFRSNTQRIICPNQITEKDVSQTKLILPSMWWTAQRFGRSLLYRWVICPTEKQVYLIVNRQVWSSINYLDKYEFVSNFGLNITRNKYNIVVLNQQMTQVGAYSCEYNPNPVNCNLWVETIGGVNERRQPK